MITLTIILFEMNLYYLVKVYDLGWLFLILLGVSLTHVVLYGTVYYFHTFTYYNFMFKTIL